MDTLDNMMKTVAETQTEALRIQKEMGDRKISAWETFNSKGFKFLWAILAAVLAVVLGSMISGDFPVLLQYSVEAGKQFGVLAGAVLGVDFVRRKFT